MFLGAHTLIRFLIRTCVQYVRYRVLGYEDTGSVRYEREKKTIFFWENKKKLKERVGLLLLLVPISGYKAV